jgi:hypothetical protein
MTYTETFELETRIGRHSQSHEARVTYTITEGRAQTYGQPAEAPEVGEMDFEINLSGSWAKCSPEMHDFLLQVLGDDLGWLIEAAREASE